MGRLDKVFGGSETGGLLRERNRRTFEDMDSSDDQL